MHLVFCCFWGFFEIIKNPIFFALYHSNLQGWITCTRVRSGSSGKRTGVEDKLFDLGWRVKCSWTFLCVLSVQTLTFKIKTFTQLHINKNKTRNPLIEITRLTPCCRHNLRNTIERIPFGTLTQHSLHNFSSTSF